MVDPSPITEADLHGYTDGRLDDERRERVEGYLRSEPAAAARLRGWRDADAELRAALAFKAAEPVPAALGIAHLGELRGRQRPRAILVAGFVLALGLGSGVGWVAHGTKNAQSATGLVSLASEATSAYRLFATDTLHPVEFDAGQTAELASWANRLTGFRVNPPDLSKSGYRLMGGRIVDTENGPACLYVYQNAAANRLTLFMRPMRGHDQSAAIRPVDTANASGFVWADNGLGFSLISSKPSPTLLSASTEVKHQMLGQL